MNAKPILLAILVSGCALGIVVAAAQQKVELPIQPPVRSTGASPVDLAREVRYACTLSYRDGGRASPVTVSAANSEEAQRNAIALGTPTAASCVDTASQMKE